MHFKKLTDKTLIMFAFKIRGYYVYIIILIIAITFNRHCRHCRQQINQAVNTLLTFQGKWRA